MNIPPELKAQFANLAANEAAEIESFFANLPAQDPEIQSLILEALDSLVDILNSAGTMHHDKRLVPVQ